MGLIKQQIIIKKILRVKNLLIFTVVAVFFLSTKAFSQNRINANYKVSYTEIKKDSIPDGYFCMVFSASSFKTKYDIWYNGRLLCKINFRDAEKSKKKKLYSLLNKPHTPSAFILIKLDSTYVPYKRIDFEIYRKKLFGLFDSEVIVCATYQPKKKYLFIVRDWTMKKLFIGTWVDFVYSSAGDYGGENGLLDNFVGLS